MSTSSSTIGQTKESKDSHAIVQGQVADRISEFPWWILFLILSGVLLAYNFTTNATYNEIILNSCCGYSGNRTGDPHRICLCDFHWPAYRPWPNVIRILRNHDWGRRIY